MEIDELQWRGNGREHIMGGCGKGQNSSYICRRLSSNFFNSIKKYFCTSKTLLKKKRPLTDGRKILSYTSGKEGSSIQIQKELL